MPARCVRGSGTTAVLLAMLSARDMTPGRLAFRNQPGVIRGPIAALSIGNLARHAISAEGPVTPILPAPPRILVPLVTMICRPAAKSSG